MRTSSNTSKNKGYRSHLKTKVIGLEVREKAGRKMCFPPAVSIKKSSTRGQFASSVVLLVTGIQQCRAGFSSHEAE